VTGCTCEVSTTVVGSLDLGGCLSHSLVVGSVHEDCAAPRPLIRPPQKTNGQISIAARFIVFLPVRFKTLHVS